MKAFPFSDTQHASSAAYCDWTKKFPFTPAWQMMDRQTDRVSESQIKSETGTKTQSDLRVEVYLWKWTALSAGWHWLLTPPPAKPVMASPASRALRWQITAFGSRNPRRPSQALCWSQALSEKVLAHRRPCWITQLWTVGRMHESQQLISNFWH